MNTKYDPFSVLLKVFSLNITECKIWSFRISLVLIPAKNSVLLADQAPQDCLRPWYTGSQDQRHISNWGFGPGPLDPNSKITSVLRIRIQLGWIRILLDKLFSEFVLLKFRLLCSIHHNLLSLFQSFWLSIFLKM